MSGWAQRDAERQEEEREALAELEPENARLRAENDLLRALLWAAIYRKGGTYMFPDNGTWLMTVEYGPYIDLGPTCDLSLIPAPVAARLVADWREATRGN